LYHPHQPISGQNYLQPFLLEVSGNGEFAAFPDLGTINLGVMTEQKELLKAQQQNSLAINNVIQSLLENGILHSQIQTFDYRIDSVYDFDQGKQLFRGYKVTHLLQVKIENLSLIGKIVDAAVQHGANYVANVQFSVRNKEAYYQRALSLALHDAFSKAKEIAKYIKVQLHPTPVLVMEEWRNNELLTNQGVSYVKGLSTTNFEPGQLLIHAKIIAHFRYSN
jgi:uncharacterized protein YggE